MLPPIAPSLGTPFSPIITIPTSIYSDWSGDDRSCGGSHVRQIWEGRHLNPLGGQLGKPEAPVEERHTGSFLLLLRFLRSCVRLLGVYTRFLDSGDDLQDPRHTGFSPHSRVGLVEEPFCVRLSGAEGGEPTATLALCMGVFDLIQPPTPPIRSLFTKAIAQKA
jgi:hypothetical protein